MRDSGLRLSSLILVLTSVISGSLFWFPPPIPLPPPSEAPQLIHIPRPTVADIQKRGVLTVLMHHDAASYFLYRGAEHGFEYELARQFAQQLGVALHVRTPPPGVALTQWLIDGKGDIAAGVVISPDAPSHVRFSHAYMATDVQVVVHTDHPLLSSPPQKTALVDDSVASHAPPAGTNTANAPEPLVQALLSGGLSGPTLFATANKQAPFAPALAPVAALVRSVYPDALQSVYTLPEPARIGWAVRAEQEDLLAAVNQYHAQDQTFGPPKNFIREVFYNCSLSRRR